MLNLIPRVALVLALVAAPERSERVFSFRVTSVKLEQAGPLPGLLGGYSRYVLTGVVLQRLKGTVADGAFTARPLIYKGPIRSRPAGLWVGVTDDVVPAPGSVWVATCTGAAATAGALLDGLGEGCALSASSS